MIGVVVVLCGWGCVSRDVAPVIRHAVPCDGEVVSRLVRGHCSLLTSVSKLRPEAVGHYVFDIWHQEIILGDVISFRIHIGYRYEVQGLTSLLCCDTVANIFHVSLVVRD